MLGEGIGEYLEGEIGSLATKPAGLASRVRSAIAPEGPDAGSMVGIVLAVLCGTGLIVGGVFFSTRYRSWSELQEEQVVQVVPSDGKTEMRAAPSGVETSRA